MKLRGISDTGMKRIAGRQGFQLSDYGLGVEDYDKPVLISRMMNALEPVIQEYMSPHEYEDGGGPGGVVRQQDAMDVVKAALQELPDEYVRRGL